MMERRPDDTTMHGAGLSRSPSLVRRRLPDFRAGPRAEVQGYLYLPAAMAARPKLWRSVNSVSAVTGLCLRVRLLRRQRMLAAPRSGSRGSDTVVLTSGL